MSLWSRVWNVFRGDRLNRELNEEFESHMEEAIAAGRDPEEVRRSFGPLLRHARRSAGCACQGGSTGCAQMSFLDGGSCGGTG